MDFFDWMLSWGNINVLAYWHGVMGWGYVVIKVLFYAGLFAWLIFWLYRKKQNIYAVDIEVVGPEKTITEFSDYARYSKDRSEIILKRRKKKILAPEKKCITPVFGRFFVKGKIRLYQFGESEFSYVPMDIQLDESQKLKFKAMDPKLPLIRALFKQSDNKFDKKSIWAQHAPVIISISFVVVCFILFLVALEQIKPVLGQLGTLIERAGAILENFDKCYVQGAGGKPPF